MKVTKRDGDSSLMQLREELRNYESLRKEHDTQIVQIAIEGTIIKVIGRRRSHKVSFMGKS